MKADLQIKSSYKKLLNLIPETGLLNYVASREPASASNGSQLERSNSNLSDLSLSQELDKVSEGWLSDKQYNSELVYKDFK